VLVAAWRLAHRRWENRYRRDALAELDRIERAVTADEAPAGLAGDLALLVRRTALAAFPRGDVAALSRTAWPSLLAPTCGGTDFSEGAGRILATLPYESPSPDATRLRPLLDLVRRWIKEHHD